MVDFNDESATRGGNIDLLPNKEAYEAILECTRFEYVVTDKSKFYKAELIYHGGTIEHAFEGQQFGGLWLMQGDAIYATKPELRRFVLAAFGHNPEDCTIDVNVLIKKLRRESKNEELSRFVEVRGQLKAKRVQQGKKWVETDEFWTKRTWKAVA